MAPIDWRDLYARNRAAIERGRGHDGRRHHHPAMDLPRGTVTAGAWEPLAEAGASGAFVYSPPSLAPGRAVPLVVMLHGCTQTAAGFAAATAMNGAADRHGFVVLYPEQDRRHNQQGCWNWFLESQQRRGQGEPARIAAAARAVVAGASRWTVDADRVFVAGLSAGGAMAAVLAATHPDLFAAVAIHSGLPYRSASDTRTAFAAMSNGGPDPARQPDAVVAAMGPRARPVPAIVVHGTADRTVAPVNGEQLVAQWLAANRLASREPFEADPRRPTSTSEGRADGGLAYTSRRWLDGRGRLVQEHLAVDGLGHAWSGGVANGSFTDPRGPSATEAICAFFARVRAHDA
jgi:poly(hydroxyalkanoate) depolymerase family esterase